MDFVVPAKCVYESACLLKSGVTGQKAQIQQVTVNTTCSLDYILLVVEVSK